MSANAPRTANSERVYAVKRADLPVSCPAPDMLLWNSHPRVYLPLEDQPEARCMYCGALYQRVD
ncbi:MAG: zinc-finger domain-containing protein [Xanthomonadales bacterium]|nr:zinc-finger domain-containing protein [Xanthomonadales bacterium]MBK7144134.1 zinc-finger domain-containing protein [Xanthomonadales bacterium]